MIKVIRNFAVKLGKGTLHKEALEGIVVDFIVEAGENYIKWDSGKLWQWGSIEVNFGIYNLETMPGIYRTEPKAIDFPIPFVGRLPKVTKDVTKVSGNNGMSVNSSAQTLTNTGHVMLVGTVKSTSPYIGIVNYDAKGWWK